MLKLGFSCIEVVSSKTGKPFLRFHGRAKDIAENLGIFRTALTLSHEKDLAIAMAVALTKGVEANAEA